MGGVSELMRQKMSLARYWGEKSACLGRAGSLVFVVRGFKMRGAGVCHRVNSAQFPRVCPTKQ